MTISLSCAWPLAAALALCPAPSAADDAKPPADILAMEDVWRGVEAARTALLKALGAAKTQAEREAAKAAYQAKHAGLAARCLRVADQHPGTRGGLRALVLAAEHFPDVPGGKEAADRFLRAVPAADVQLLAEVIGQGGAPRSAETARVLLDRAKRSLDQPPAARLLAAVCVAAAPGEDDQEPSAPFAEAAGLIADRFPDSPDICHFGEALESNGVAEPWAVRYLPQLRTVAEKNPHRQVRCTVKLALAAATRAAGDEAGAERLFEQYLAEFDGKAKYSFQGIEQMFRQNAERELADIRTCGVGKPAPDVDGTDLDGTPMKLSDYRGKVVLVSFWATWCGPCMKLIPHERELAERFVGKPFALIGVNGDDKPEAAREAAAKHRVTWRSFRDKRPDKPAISEAWHVGGWPTLYLIDHTGTVRRRWAGTPRPADLDRAVAELVANAERP